MSEQEIESFFTSLDYLVPDFLKKRGWQVVSLNRPRYDSHQMPFRVTLAKTDVIDAEKTPMNGNGSTFELAVAAASNAIIASHYIDEEE